MIFRYVLDADKKMPSDVVVPILIRPCSVLVPHRVGGVGATAPAMTVCRTVVPGPVFVESRFGTLWT